MAKLNPKSLQNLRPKKSLDGALDLQLISVRLPKSVIECLDNMPGDRSSNLRAAIALYLSEN